MKPRPVKRMSDAQVAHALLVEAHRFVDEAADAAVAMIGAPPGLPPPPVVLVYPPGADLAAEEARALQRMSLSDVERVALRKVVADACGQMLFGLLTVVDGMADPEVKPPGGVWLGARLVAPTDDTERDVLHDGFLDARRDYEQRTRPKEPRAGRRRSRPTQARKWLAAGAAPRLGVTVSLSRGRSRSD